MRKHLLLLACLSPLMNGCMAHYKIAGVKGQLADAKGLIYYLPKPYLVLTNMEIADPAKSTAAASTSDAKQANSKQTRQAEGGSQNIAPSNKDTADAPTEDGTKVTASIIYLPDPDNARAITVSKSIGTFKSGIQLNNGWMLTGINSDADAKFAETVTAFSGIVSSALKAGFVPNTSNGTTSKQAAFFYLFEMDLEHHTLKAVDSTCIKDALTHLNGTNTETELNADCQAVKTRKADSTTSVDAKRSRAH